MPKEAIFTYGDIKYTEAEFRKFMEKSNKEIRSDSRLAAVLKMVDGKRILDIGCYVGILSRVLAQEGKDVLAIDILQPEIDKAKMFNQVRGVRYECGDILNMKFPDNDFDCILLLEAIEHLNEPTLFLKELFRILKPGGSLIISTPNATSYMNILYQIFFLFKKKQLEFINSLSSELQNTGTQLDHIYAWDFRTLLRYLFRNGFEYYAHKFVGAYPFKIYLGKLSLSILGKKEMKFLLPWLGPYLSTLVVKVKKHKANKTI